MIMLSCRKPALGIVCRAVGSRVLLCSQHVWAGQWQQVSSWLGERWYTSHASHRGQRNQSYVMAGVDPAACGESRAAVSCEGVQAAEGLCPKESSVPSGSFISAAEECSQHPAEHHHSLAHFSQCFFLQEQLWVPSSHPVPLCTSAAAMAEPSSSMK